MNLAIVFFSTLAAGVGSVWVAAGLLRLGAGQQDKGQNALLSLAAGALLATAFTHLLPEAFNSEADAHTLFAVLLAGIVFFFMLTKAELWHHAHEHQPPHAHDHHHHGLPHAHDAHGHVPRGRGAGWSLLAGDSVHCFGDGVLIASAFAADVRLGLVAALSVLAHEVPHHMGDLIVLRQGQHRAAAVWKVSLAGVATALGGVCGYFLLAGLQDWQPYLLTLACSSFIYVALSDLIPQLQRQMSPSQSLVQIAWLGLGIAVVTLVSGMAHAH